MCLLILTFSGTQVIIGHLPWVIMFYIYHDQAKKINT